MLNIIVTSAPKKVSEEQKEKMRQRIKQYGFKKKEQLLDDIED